MRITTSNPPEDGFEHMGGRRYKVFCNGEMLSGVLKVDTEAGVAWVAKRDERGRHVYDAFRQTVQTVKVQGEITVERIQ